MNPRGIAGDIFRGPLKAVLERSARQQKFVSPYWLTVKGADKAGLRIAPHEKGTCVQGYGAPLVLYNVQQTIDCTARHGTIPKATKEHFNTSFESLPPALQNGCNKQASLKGYSQAIWGSRRDFLARGILLSPTAEPLQVGQQELFNISQCVHPDAALASLLISGGVQLRRVNGSVLSPSDVSAARRLLRKLRDITVVLRDLPPDVRSQFASLTAQAATNCYFASAEDMRWFGTQVREDPPTIALTALVDLLSCGERIDGAVVRGILDRVVRGEIRAEERLWSGVSVGPNGLLPCQFAECTDHFTPSFCTARVGPLSIQSNTFLASTTNFSFSDAVTLLEYRQRHQLLGSTVWFGASSTSCELLSLSAPATPCVLHSGDSVFSAEQTSVYTRMLSREGSHAKADEIFALEFSRLKET